MHRLSLSAEYGAVVVGNLNFSPVLGCYWHKYSLKNPIRNDIGTFEYDLYFSVVGTEFYHTKQGFMKLFKQLATTLDILIRIRLNMENQTFAKKWEPG